MIEVTNNPEKGEKEKNYTYQDTHHKRKHKQPRPLFLSVISVFAFVFYGLISVLFLLALFSSGWISEVRNKYLPEGAETKQMIILITAAGFLLHLISLIGSINIWHRRKSGYLMLSISTLIIALFQLLSNRISIFTTAVYIFFIILFGIYYRRFH
jgi:magnesium-transporting ATPase (P-type)